jgi:hypothetical protein
LRHEAAKVKWLARSLAGDAPKRAGNGAGFDLLKIFINVARLLLNQIARRRFFGKMFR